jgi:hypothetical protein
MPSAGMGSSVVVVGTDVTEGNPAPIFRAEHISDLEQSKQ